MAVGRGRCRVFRIFRKIGKNRSFYLLTLDSSSDILCNKNSRSLICEKRKAGRDSTFKVTNIDLCTSGFDSFSTFST